MKRRERATPPAEEREEPPRADHDHADELHETVVQQLLRNIAGGAAFGAQPEPPPAEPDGPGRHAIRKGSKGDA